MEELFRLKYGGRAVEFGEMDARSVAEAVGGFADFIGRVGTAIYGAEAEIRSTVRPFREGSFEILMLFQHLAEGASFTASILSETNNLIEIAKECIELLKHLKGEAPNSIKKAENGGIFVENNQGMVNIYKDITVNLVLQDPVVGRSTGKFIRTPLTKAAESLEVYANDEIVAKATQEDAASFGVIESADTLTENVVEVWLLIRTVVLKGDARWKFFDGRNSINAPIEDDDFRKRVEDGEERFGSGDALYVRLRSTQKRIRGEMRAEYVVEQVLDHQRATGGQGTLF